MKCAIASFAFAALLSSLPAAASEGENLLVNGTFVADQAEFPEFWSRSSTENIVYESSGGPDGKGSVGLRGAGASTGTVSVRQQDLTLVPGETYKLSGYVKTKGFQCRSGGLIVHNSGWLSATGLTKFPPDSQWTFMERTFKLFESKDNQYGVAIYAIGPAGEIDFADVKLEAVSEAARKGSRSPWSAITAARLVPVEPLLSKIPRERAELKLKFYGSLDGRRDGYECVATIAGSPTASQTIPVEDGEVLVRLDGLGCGEYSLETAVRHSKTGETVLRTAYPIRIVDTPKIDRGKIRRLNNLVAEVLNEPVPAGPDPRVFPFANPRDGWVFVALSTETPGPGLTVRMDDSDTLITGETDRLEAFRELPMGEHRITVTGNAEKACLVVRSIPEIFNYPPCTNSYVAENGPYDWNFMKEHVLHAVTTLNGGRLPGDAFGEAKARGLKWLANFNVAPLDDPADVRQRMEKHPGMTEPQYDGLTSDELFFGRASMAHYTEALWRLRNPEKRLVYTWIVGKPGIPSLHTDFMSACVNVSAGRGRLLFEAYCHPQADEKAAAVYLDDRIGETIRLFNAYLPNAAAGTGIIFGNFNQIPIISLEHDPAVDFKYFLDMQVNLVANDPDFAGLATVGYWGTYYADEELARWSFQLMRHYAVEGNREMLSNCYGFKYNPALIVNGDFAGGLEGWELSPAAEGSIRPATIDGYGKNCQGRWGAGKAGDTVCVMTRCADKPNRIRQTATGLEVGRAYCLQFVTADFRDVVEHKHNPRRYGIDVELEGAEILPDKSFVHVDRRKAHRSHDSRYLGKINLHRVVFRARAARQAIAFSDEKSVPGEACMMNFIQLKPYLE